MTTMRVLITGGAGFIGSRLAERLAMEGAEVTAFDNFHPQVHDGNPENRAFTRPPLHQSSISRNTWCSMPPALK